jgi:CBS domain-containing membrane protein
MQVRDIMSTDLITLNEDDDLDLAQLEMSWAGIRHLPVVAEDRLVGLVTHRDILGSMCSVFAELDNQQQSELFRMVAVSAIMSREIQTVGPEVDAARAARVLLKSKIGCLPVVEDKDHLVGIVTEADFVQLSVRLFDKRMNAELGDVPDNGPNRFMRDNDDNDEDW